MPLPAPLGRALATCRRRSAYVRPRDLSVVLRTATDLTLVVLDDDRPASWYPGYVRVVGQLATPVERVNRWAEPRQAARTPSAVLVPIRPVRHEPVFETERWQTLTVRKAS